MRAVSIPAVLLLLAAAPQAHEELFDLAKTSADKAAAAALGAHIVEFAQGQAQADPTYHALGDYRKLVRVAFQLAATDETVAAAHAKIKAGQPPDPPKGEIGRDDLMTKLTTLLAKTRAGKGRDDFAASRYLCAVGLMIAPTNETCLTEFENLKRGGEIQWERVLTVYRRAIPDGTTSSVKGLAVSSAGTAQVGSVARIVLTFRSTAAMNLQVKLLREEADQTQTSAEEAIRYWDRMRKHVPLPGGLLEISFEDKFTKKDGPSAGAAFAVLLRSFSDPFQIDPAVAMTGDISVEGRILQVGGVFAKIRGAVMGGCARVGIPASCEAELVDAVVLNGAATLGEIEVLALDSIDDAIAMSRADRDERDRRVSADFAKLRGLVEKKVKGNNDPATAADIQKLAAAIVAAQPRHVSARLIAAWNERKLPAKLTLASSLDEAFKIIHGYLIAIQSGDALTFNDISKEAKTTTINDVRRRLEELAPKLHPDAVKPAKKLETVCMTIRDFIQKREGIERQEKKVAEIDKILTDLKLKIDKAEKEGKPVEEQNRLVKRYNSYVVDYKNEVDKHNKLVDERKKIFEKVIDHWNEYITMMRTLVQDPKLLEKLQHGK